MLIQAGDPRDFLPVERLRREIIGDAANTGEDAQFADHLRSAASEIAVVGGSVLDAVREYPVGPIYDDRETVRINRLWVRSLSGVQWLREDTGEPGGQVAVAGLAPEIDRGGISIPAPEGGWPGTRLRVTLSEGLDPGDTVLGLVRETAILLVRGYMDGAMKRGGMSSVEVMLRRIRRAAFLPTVTAKDDLRGDDFRGA